MYNQVLHLRFCIGINFPPYSLLKSSLSGAVMQLLSYFRLHPYTELTLMKQSCARSSSISWVKKDTLYGYICDLVKRFLGKPGD